MAARARRQRRGDLRAADVRAARDRRLGHGVQHPEARRRGQRPRLHLPGLPDRERRQGAARRGRDREGHRRGRDLVAHRPLGLPGQRRRRPRRLRGARRHRRGPGPRPRQGARHPVHRAADAAHRAGFRRVRLHLLRPAECRAGQGARRRPSTHSPSRSRSSPPRSPAADPEESCVRPHGPVAHPGRLRCPARTRPPLAARIPRAGRRARRRSRRRHRLRRRSRDGARGRGDERLAGHVPVHRDAPGRHRHARAGPALSRRLRPDDDEPRRPDHPPAHLDDHRGAAHAGPLGRSRSAPRRAPTTPRPTTPARPPTCCPPA